MCLPYLTLARDKKETLSQNYSRFGLVAKLGTTAGGTQKSKKNASIAPKDDPLAVRSADRGLLPVTEVKVERDASGKIVRVLRDINPLNDPLNELDSDSEENQREKAKTYTDVWNGIDEDSRPEVIRALEREAAQPVAPKVRHQSERELEWLQRLVDKHGEDVGAMARDAKLNPMQQTKADITKRLRKAGLL